MDEENRTTINAYEKEAKSYIHNTPVDYQPHHAPMLKWIDAALSGLRGQSVLEIGSATPRDANYIRNKGFEVQTSDATPKFVEYLRQRGDNAILLNALTDKIPEGFDLIFANAVAPHFTQRDLISFLNSTLKTLPEGGRVAFNLKIGTRDKWIHEKFKTKRFIHHWKPKEIQDLLKRYRFTIIFFDINNKGDLPTHHWINIVVEKNKKTKSILLPFSVSKRRHPLKYILNLSRHLRVSRL